MTETSVRSRVDRATRRRVTAHRPHLSPGLPVLWRDRRTVQVGLRPRLLFTDLPEPLARVLTRLDGRSSLEELLAVPGVEAADLRRLLAEFHRLGLLNDLNERRPRPAVGNRRRLTGDRQSWAVRHPTAEQHQVDGRSAHRVEVRGDGRLAPRIAELLAASGIGQVTARASGVVRDEDVGSGYTDSDVGRRRAEVLSELIRRGAPEVSARQRGTPSLIVLTDTWIIDPVVSRALHRRGLAHLPVTVREGVGVIGPLVQPGRSSCLTCADIHRTEADPGWPRLAAQLLDRTPPADLATIEATAGLAVAQILSALGSWRPAGPPPIWNTVLEVDAYQCVLSRTAAPPHPRCSCGASRHTDRQAA